MKFNENQWQFSEKSEVIFLFPENIWNLQNLKSETSEKSKSWKAGNVLWFYDLVSTFFHSIKKKWFVKLLYLGSRNFVHHFYSYYLHIIEQIYFLKFTTFYEKCEIFTSYEKYHTLRTTMRIYRNKCEWLYKNTSSCEFRTFTGSFFKPPSITTINQINQILNNFGIGPQISTNPPPKHPL